MPLPDGDSRFQTAYKDLLISSVNRQVGRDGGLFVFGEDDAAFLLSVASRLALGHEPKENALAYAIVSRILELFGDRYPTIVDAAKIILARLGNFPAFDVANERFDVEGGYSATLGDLEIISRQLENSIEIKQRLPVVLTDFQYKLYDVRAKSHSVSVSAPTSAGKSFLLSLDIVRYFLRNKGKTVVILVPTRALIRQVMRDVIERLNEYDLGHIHVSCISDPVEPELLEAGQVLVFTQERLTTLLNDKDRDVDIGLLVVDEAQEIEDDSRGIVLQTAIERALRRSPQTEVLFACPLRSNPRFLLDLFKRDSEGAYFTEENSPVNQNIILVHQVDRQETMVRLELVHDKEHVEIGTLDLKRAFRGHIQLQASAVLSLTQQGEASIVYANDPSTAEDVALALAKELPEITKSAKAISEVITFVKRQVHPKHLLVQTLQHGVAFHYGNLPDVVRMGVEDLFRKGHIQYICCTSTLLQGINLPAKNVFMYRPTKGRGNSLKGGPFWNLAGRAGRMRHEFGGNVYCLMPDDWEFKPFDEEKLVPIEAALASTLEENSQGLIDVISNNSHASENKDQRTEEQAFGKIFADVTAGRLPEATPSLSDAARQSLDKVTDLCRDLAATITLPIAIFERNSGVSPHRIEELARYFRDERDLSLLIPIRPETTGALKQLDRIFEVCNTVFFKQANKTYLHYSRLAFYWMLGQSLKDEIKFYLKKKRTADESKDITDAIRTLLEEIGTDVRYRYVKYLRVYYDVMEQCLKERKQESLISKMSKLHLFMEYGACTQSLIHLMALGVSRDTALLYSKAAGLTPAMTAEDVERRFESTDPSLMRLPALCRNEVQVLRRKVEVT